MPVIAGAKRAGIIQTVLGIDLIVVGVYAPYPNLIAASVAMTAGGVIQMLSPQASGLRQSDSPDSMQPCAVALRKHGGQRQPGAYLYRLLALGRSDFLGIDMHGGQVVTYPKVLAIR